MVIKTSHQSKDHTQRLREILECFIVSSAAKDHLVLSQYDLHHGSFLLVTPIVMFSYKSTITHCKLKHFPLVACFTQLQAWFKVKKILTLPPSVEDNLFVNKPEGHLLQGWRLSLWVATSPKLWAAFCPFHLCTCQ